MTAGLDFKNFCLFWRKEPLTPEDIYIFNNNGKIKRHTLLKQSEPEFLRGLL